MSARDLALLTKVLALFVMFESATLALVAGILAYDVIVAGGSPITTNLFGPEIHATPALVWTYIQQFSALIAMAGGAAVASQSRWWRAGAGMAVVGNLLLVGLMGLLAYHARTAPDGVAPYLLDAGPAQRDRAPGRGTRRPGAAPCTVSTARRRP